MKVIKNTDPYVVCQGVVCKLQGHFPAIKQFLPAFALQNSQQAIISQEHFLGKSALIYVCCSVETPINANIIRVLATRSSNWHKTRLCVISNDLPFALAKFQQSEKLSEIPFLSCHHNDFPENYGLMISEGKFAGLMAGAVMLINEQGMLQYFDRMINLTDEPNYESIFQLCK